MSYFKSLPKGLRKEALARGVVRTAAGYADVSVATASRTFADKLKHPNYQVVKALKRALAEMVAEKREALHEPNVTGGAGKKRARGSQLSGAKAETVNIGGAR